jgi:hypothetical protein
MERPSLRPVFIVLFVALQASSAFAQSILNRVVGAEANHHPLIVNELTGQAVGRLAAAAGVPMGIEIAPGNPGPHPGWPIVASGKHVLEVLDALVEADPRYRWQEDNGVIVFRPGAAWAASSDILDIQIGPIALDRVDSGDAMRVLEHVFGVRRGTTSGPGDTKKFSVDLPPQSSLLQSLDAIVRAHGTLAWAIDFPVAASGSGVDFPLTVMLFSGPAGSGFGIPRTAAVLQGPIAAGHRHAESAHVPVLNRIVGPTPDGRPLKIVGINGYLVSRLAAAVGVPMGVETSTRKLTTVPSGFEGITVTGMPLGLALEAIASLDPRFNWREMDGVIVFRTGEAWGDPHDLLSRVVPGAKLDDMRGSDAIGLVASTLGAPAHATNNFSDSRHFSIDLPHGSTVLDLLNAVVRSHGELSWELSELRASSSRPNGYRHALSFSFFSGTGSGFDVP